VRARLDTEQEKSEGFSLFGSKGRCDEMCVRVISCMMWRDMCVMTSPLSDMSWKVLVQLQALHVELLPAEGEVGDVGCVCEEHTCTTTGRAHGERGACRWRRACHRHRNGHCRRMRVNVCAVYMYGEGCVDDACVYVDVASCL
jgi:hypothetical protein